ncbi:AAA family ATPase [Candidatus Dependentiae bacterium]|nr:AAA family ATPase [Candidatus Dependentiae bacterium]
MKISKIVLVLLMASSMMTQNSVAVDWRNIWEQSVPYLKQIEMKHIWTAISIASTASAFMGWRKYNKTAIFSRPTAIKSEITFNDFYGAPEKIKQFVNLFPKVISSGNTELIEQLPKAYLFTGVAGTGKTTLAMALAGQLKAPLFVLEADSSLLFPFIGSFKLSQYINAAQAAAQKDPSKLAIIFIDEIHLVADGQFSLLHSLLTKLDGVATKNITAPNEKAGHVLIIGATNKDDLIDSALKRPGRFEEVRLSKPDIGLTKLLLKKYLGENANNESVDLIVNCLAINFMTPAEIKMWASKAKLASYGRADKVARIELIDLEEAFLDIAKTIWNNTKYASEAALKILHAREDKIKKPKKEIKQFTLRNGNVVPLDENSGNTPPFWYTVENGKLVSMFGPEDNKKEENDDEPRIPCQDSAVFQKGYREKWNAQRAFLNTK